MYFLRSNIKKYISSCDLLFWNLIYEIPRNEIEASFPPLYASKV